MTKMGFQKIKQKFGTKETKLLNEFKFPVPGLPNDYTHDEARIRSGRMIFARLVCNAGTKSASLTHSAK